MSNLIYGKEALIALANGKDVLYIGHHHKDKPIKSWGNARELVMEDLLNDAWAFKLKPRTIAINGIEVPACGENYKYHEFMYVLNSLEVNEYSKIILDESDELPDYWWQTENEIKQVVEVLRSIFK